MKMYLKITSWGPFYPGGGGGGGGHELVNYWSFCVGSINSMHIYIAQVCSRLYNQAPQSICQPCLPVDLWEIWIEF